MSPEYKIKKTILLEIQGWLEDPPEGFEGFQLETEQDIKKTWEFLDEHDYIQDARNDFREGQEKTNIPTQYNRHYELYSVAAQMFDGSWVGWTYWYGGGKHGEPEAIDWMEYAYNLDCKEEEKLILVRTFKKIPESS